MLPAGHWMLACGVHFRGQLTRLAGVGLQNDCQAHLNPRLSAIAEGVGVFDVTGMPKSVLSFVAMLVGPCTSKKMSRLQHLVSIA